MTSDLALYDVIGVGFGPSNLSLAIALDEAVRRRGGGFRARFLDRQKSFAWHSGMLLPGSDMQISFLKDLVLLRDPGSRFTFLNYLHQKGRLEAFINQKTFYPSRLEFNDYLLWAADHFADKVSYGEEVVAVEPEDKRGNVAHLAVRSRDASGRERTRLARNLVLAVGGRPNIPAAFRGLVEDSRIFHSSTYLGDISALGLADHPATRVAVVGGGQSAAEIALDLHKRFAHIGIDMIARGFALRPSDNTPFVNEIFNPGHTDFIYGQAPSVRDSILGEFRNTNYAVVDADLIQTLYGILYQQRIMGEHRMAILGLRDIEQASTAGPEVALSIRDNASGAVSGADYSAVILATGYKRDNGGELLDAVRAYIHETKLERDYRLPAKPEFRPAIYLQGYSESTHGLSDTLLSVLAIRAQEIASSLLAAADAQQSAA